MMTTPETVLDRRMRRHEELLDEYRSDAVLTIVEAFGRAGAAALINAALNGELSIFELRQTTIEKLIRRDP